MDRLWKRRRSSCRKALLALAVALLFFRSASAGYLQPERAEFLQAAYDGEPLDVQVMLLINSSLMDVEEPERYVDYFLNPGDHYDWAIDRQSRPPRDLRNLMPYEEADTDFGVIAAMFVRAHHEASQQDDFDPTEGPADAARPFLFNQMRQDLDLLASYDHPLHLPCELLFALGYENPVQGTPAEALFDEVSHGYTSELTSEHRESLVGYIDTAMASLEADPSASTPAGFGVLWELYIHQIGSAEHLPFVAQDERLKGPLQTARYVFEDCAARDFMASRLLPVLKRSPCEPEVEETLLSGPELFNSIWCARNHPDVQNALYQVVTRPGTYSHRETGRLLYQLVHTDFTLEKARVGRERAERDIEDLMQKGRVLQMLSERE